MRERRAAPRVAVVALTVLVLTAPAGHPGVAEPNGRFDWPLRPRPTVEKRFDNPEHDWLPGHRGVDLAGTPGQPVLAAGAGIVVYAGTVAGKPVVSIDHAGGLRTTYEPVEAEVPVGRRVASGTRIGVLRAGHDGCAAAACLHWGLRRDGAHRGRPEYLDPLGLLRLATVRLKPVRAGRVTGGGRRRGRRNAARVSTSARSSAVGSDIPRYRPIRRCRWPPISPAPYRRCGGSGPASPGKARHADARATTGHRSFRWPWRAPYLRHNRPGHAIIAAWGIPINIETCGRHTAAVRTGTPGRREPGPRGW